MCFKMLFLQVICMGTEPFNGQIKNSSFSKTLQVTANNVGSNFGECGGFPEASAVEVNPVLQSVQKSNLCWFQKSQQRMGPMSCSCGWHHFPGEPQPEASTSPCLGWLRYVLMLLVLPATITGHRAHPVNTQACSAVGASCQFLA